MWPNSHGNAVAMYSLYMSQHFIISSDRLMNGSSNVLSKLVDNVYFSFPEITALRSG